MDGREEECPSALPAGILRVSTERVEVGASGASPFPVMTDRIAPGLPGSPQASMLTLTLPLNPYFTLNQESLLSLCPHLARACLPL